jgi:hypothetical protein
MAGGLQGQVGWIWNSNKTGIRTQHLDPTTHAQVEIAAEHHEIHEGHMWHASHYDADVDTSEDKTILITTPAVDIAGVGTETIVHFASQVFVDQAATITFLEGVTTIVGGTALTAFNRNRNATNTLNTVLKYDVTSYAGGTAIETIRLGIDGTPGSKENIGGATRTDAVEWNLKPSTSYLILIEPDADDLVVTVELEFYEHQHKDTWDEEAIGDKWRGQ